MRRRFSARLRSVVLAIFGFALGVAAVRVGCGQRHILAFMPQAGQTASGQLPSLPVAIQSWHYDPKEKTVTLHLVNNSHKDVTAFNISIAERYADGSSNYVDGRLDYQYMRDIVMGIIAIERFVPQGSGTPAVGSAELPLAWLLHNETFAAGTSRDQEIYGEKGISDVEAVVDVVVYADHTADVQNEKAFKRLLAERKGKLLAMEKVTEVIKCVLADPIVISPFDAAIRQLIPLVSSADNIKNPPTEEAEGDAAMHLQNDIRSLQMVQRSKLWSRMKLTEREWLARDVEEHEKRIALMKPHCELVTK